MPKFWVLTPLLTAEGRLEPGEEVDLKPKEARELLAAGAISKEKPVAVPVTTDSAATATQFDPAWLNALRLHPGS
ncbi:hypothetical protein OR16_31724 [Cupriavidus basilensis OR16]|uniref:Uncharacterized protein n=1 Tax=Cupriavidus basilensis OR16 TaxID=1127483 RepID=H1SDG8_9BURK|nr:hypothetical protein [Cupriavidus basilensis]EHP39422.1 hypothetical protein OR16_31724 [Cupriavidus basilensis OR16]